jgi:hypothetical protein
LCKLHVFGDSVQQNQHEEQQVAEEGKERFKIGMGARSIS